MPTAEASSFRQVEEKFVNCAVEQMVWSPRMDLIALANVNGEVVLHRLSWQKVWSLPAPDGAKLCSMAWRPDGKVLAVGYSNGRVILCDVENASNLHTIIFDGGIDGLCWINEKNSDSDSVKCEFYSDESSTYLPKLIPFPKAYNTTSKGHGEENVEDPKKLKKQTSLNLLIVALTSGVIQLHAFGVFPCGTFNLQEKGIIRCTNILSLYLTEDLNLLSIIASVQTNDGHSKHIDLITLDTSLFASHHKELRILALMFGQVLTLMMYLNSTIQQMTEAWEDILLEMDSKLIKFAEEKKSIKSGSVSNDFLRLLMMGTPSEELQRFLLNELTDRGLKKLGHSIETSYSNIQKLVLKHLQSVGHALIYHLGEVGGMAKCYDKFGILGLCPNKINVCISKAGSFMLKASELQQVIDSSIKNFKAFFKWLYVVMKGLSEEPIPAELTKMTQQDLNFVAQFLKENFTEEYEGFKLEKVGQYLKNEELMNLPETEMNPWIQFLKENPALKEGNILYEFEPKKSLVQLHHNLKDSIDVALNGSTDFIGNQFQSIYCGTLFSLSEHCDVSKIRISQFFKKSSSGGYLYFLITTQTTSCENCLILRQDTCGKQFPEAVCIKFQELNVSNIQEDADYKLGPMKYFIEDISYYNDETISLLLSSSNSNGSPLLVQVPFASIEEMSYVLLSDFGNINDIPCTDLGYLVDNLNCRILENMQVSSFAVSGSRNVACVLFSSKRRVRLFLMDAEEDDEDDNDLHLSHYENTSDISNINQSHENDDENKENSRESAMEK